MHYYSFHIGDYKSHTHHLSLIEDIAYRRLLDHYYLHEAPILQRQIARQIGMRDHEQEVLSVLDEFFVSTEDGYINPRADEEIAKYKELSLAGKRGAEKRWAKAPDSPPIATPLVPQSDSNATPIATINQEPITNNHKPKRDKATGVACPPTVDQQVWSDWLIIRKAKSLPMTETAWGQIQNEFRKANLSDQEGVKYCCLSNWASFKISWYEKQMQEQNSGLTKSAQAKQKVLSGLTRGLIGGSNVKLLG